VKRAAALLLVAFVLGGLVGASAAKELMLRRIDSYVGEAAARRPAPQKSPKKPASGLKLERDIRDGEVIAERVILADGRVIPVPPSSTATAR
jgi:hypothetical protein